MHNPEETAWLDVDEAERFAQAFLSARRTASVVAFGEERERLQTIGAGRAVAATIDRLLTSEGVGAVGLKLGAHTAAAQQALGLSESAIATIYDEWLLPTDATIELTRFVSPKLESEIGFRKVGDEWDATACFEVVDSRWPNWSGRAGQFFADFAFNGAVIFGENLKDDSQLDFELHHAGDLVQAGTASVAEARQRLAKHASRPEVKLIATGSLHPAVALTPGLWTLTFTGGGQVSIELSPPQYDLA